MQTSHHFWKTSVLLVLLFGAGSAWAAAKKEPPPPLTATGQKLQEQYAAMLTDLQGQVTRELPKIDPQQRAKFLDTFAAEGNAGKYSEKNPDFVKATENTARAASPILDGIGVFLAGGPLDPTLVKATVIAQATPRGLAVFAQQGKPQEALVEKLLADPGLIRQMLVAGGAHDGDYGRAMEIYTALQKASPNAREGVLQRLALAISLDQVSSQGGALDPLKRYRIFEQAYLDGVLDPVFPTLTTWEMRMVVDEPYTDEEIEWVRQVMQNYRPDVMTIDYRWRYSELSTDEVKYTHIHWGLVPGSKAEQILASGGVCGPRAWFGRLATRAFGIPVWGEQQPGHAAWTHWTPDGFIICQGASWDVCHWYGQPGMDFYRESQARRYPVAYEKVLRCRWIGDTLGEERCIGSHLGQGGFWPALGLAEERAIVAENKPSVAQRTGPNKFWGPIDIPATARQIEVAPDGTITVPAVACTQPTNNTAKIRFVKSDLGGLQLHYARLGRTPETFTYTVNAPAAGTYALTARTVTVNLNQRLLLTANHAKAPVDIVLPYTGGMWGKTAPVPVKLVAGPNVLQFGRDTNDVRGVTIKDFTLAPVK